jgi:hypothetical protein
MIIMKDCATYELKIFVGSRIGYTSEYANASELYDVCREYCTDIGLCVTVTPTDYIYKDGEEAGFIIGLINYPRFPSSEQKLLLQACRLAEILMKKMKQYRVTLMTPERTYMFENEEMLNDA